MLSSDRISLPTKVSTKTKPASFGTIKLETLLLVSHMTEATAMHLNAPYLQCGKFVSHGGDINIGRAILMLSIYLLHNLHHTLSSQALLYCFTLTLLLGTKWVNIQRTNLLASGGFSFKFFTSLLIHGSLRTSCVAGSDKIALIFSSSAFDAVASDVTALPASTSDEL